MKTEKPYQQKESYNKTERNDIMIAVIDYGAGNIFSVKNALDFLGMENRLTSSAKDIESADAVILPGVGAFPKAMDMLEKAD